MMKKFKIVAALALGLFLMLGAAVCWSGPDNAGGERMKQANGFDREKVAERMEKYRLNRMDEKLDLSENQRSKIKDILRDERDERRDMMERMKKEMDTLKMEADKENPDERVLEKSITTLRDLREEMHRSETKTADKIQSTLTPLQQAQFILFQQDFRREMMGMIRDRHQDFKGPRGGLGHENGRGDNEKRPCPPEPDERD